MALVNDRLRNVSSRRDGPYWEGEVWPRGLIDGQCPCKLRSDTVSPSPRSSLRMQIGLSRHCSLSNRRRKWLRNFSCEQKKIVHQPTFNPHLSQYIVRRYYGKPNLSRFIDWRRALKARSPEFWSREMKNERWLTRKLLYDAFLKLDWNLD